MDIHALRRVKVSEEYYSSIFSRRKCLELLYTLYMPENESVMQNFVVAQETGYFLKLVQFTAHLLYHRFFSSNNYVIEDFTYQKKNYKSGPNLQQLLQEHHLIQGNQVAFFSLHIRVISQWTIQSAAPTGHLYITWSLLKTINSNKKEAQEGSIHRYC